MDVVSCDGVEGCSGDDGFVPSSGGEDALAEPSVWGSWLLSDSVGGAGSYGLVVEWEEEEDAVVSDQMRPMAPTIGRPMPTRAASLVRWKN